MLEEVKRFQVEKSLESFKISTAAITSDLQINDLCHVKIKIVDKLCR